MRTAISTGVTCPDNFVVELPFGKGKHWLNRGGMWIARSRWELTGFGRVTSGRPSPSLRHTTVSNVCNPRELHRLQPRRRSAFTDPANGLVWYFDAAERAKFSAPAAGQFGNLGPNLPGPQLLRNGCVDPETDRPQGARQIESAETRRILTYPQFRRPDHGHHSTTFGASELAQQRLQKNPGGRKSSIFNRGVGLLAQPCWWCSHRPAQASAAR